MRRFIKVTLQWLSIALCWAAVEVVAQHTETSGNSQTEFSSHDEVSIKALSRKKYRSEINLEKLVYERPKYRGELVWYLSDGLKVYALLNTPTAEMPKGGYPVVIFAHGFHPDPPNYGVSQSGKVSRPGDYYRGVPESFAERGFVVLSPDFRGHNVSEGRMFTKRSYLNSSYYASDVLHALASLKMFDNVNMNRIYFVGHSMGGEVGLKVLLSTNLFTAASLWSATSATTDQQALYYGQYYGSSDRDKPNLVTPQIMDEFNREVDALYSRYGSGARKQDVDPINHLSKLSTPLNLHHARGDRAAPYMWTENLVGLLRTENKNFNFYIYESDDHLFKGEDLDLAIQRDINFFNERERIEKNP